jgi:lysylphosphatidylglycerol synthetase-like protein (DUF2156 family)
VSVASEPVLDLVCRYGYETVAWQGLGPGFAHWVGAAGAVSYVDTGGAWVAAGSPLAPIDRLAGVAAEFAAAAAELGRRACFFAAEQRLVDAGLTAMRIGEQPVWRVDGWAEILGATASLRYQLARARRKGVTTRPFEPRDADALDVLGARWQTAHRMPPMQFLVQLAPLGLGRTIEPHSPIGSHSHSGMAIPPPSIGPHSHSGVLHAAIPPPSIAVAERDGALVGFASAIPVPARDRLFVEHFVRAPDAPNGTVELLVDAMVRASPAPEVTLGLAPLAGHVSRWLRLARWLGTPFYDFAGLRAFKAKLRPHAWEPVYLCTTGGSTLVALRDALRAFAGGTLVGFASRALVR